MAGQPTVSIAVQTPDPTLAVQRIGLAEQAGVTGAWLTTGRLRFDALTALGAAAVETNSILLGTAVIPTWPRHPLAVAQQVLALEGLAPGRIRLGVGPSTAASMRPFGVSFREPLGQLAEHVSVLRSFLQDGAVDHEGAFVSARGRLRRPPGTPVLSSALNEAAFELSGAMADGVITWMCPSDYVANIGVPALARAAEHAGRAVPALVLHVPVVVGTADDALAAARRDVGPYLGFAFYREMFAKSGFPTAAHELSAAHVGRLVAYGSADEVAGRLVELSALGEVMAMPLSGGGEDEKAFDDGLHAVGLAARSLAQKVARA